MSNLPENKLYSPAQESFSSKPLLGAIKSLTSNPIRSPKAVGISPAARGVASSVQSINGGMSGLRQGAGISLGTVTTPYGGSTNYEGVHPGIDIAAKMGTPVSAFTGGRVIQMASGRKQGDKGYGNYVILVDDQGNQHRYSHLSQQYVRVGQTIPAGYRLGAIGNSGSTYSTSGGDGSHLDYRVMDAYKKYLDPSRFLKLASK